MCGIAGILSWNGGSCLETVNRMVLKLIHRGPDSSGFWNNGIFSAGMRRLSIVDVAGGGQPLYDEAKKIIVFYNGEIYNYRELRFQLELQGVRFRTDNDGEVICHLYRKYGKNLFEKIDGMYSIALWDDENKILLLARDYPGEKPLYFSLLKNGGIAFSSEIKSILECTEIDRDLDMQALWDYPTFLWIPEPATIYKKVRAIMPGEYLVVSSTSIERFSFKEKLSIPDLPYSTQDLVIKSVRDVVTASVISRLQSDVAIGSFLSGGLDSSIVVAIARKELRDLHTFCIGFEDISDPYHGYSDESKYAEHFAKVLQTKHTTVRATAKEFRDLLPRFIKSAGQPYAVSSGLGILAIAQQARRNGIKVLLSGDGADEAFGGYSWYSRIPSSFNSQVIQGQKKRFVELKDKSIDEQNSIMAGYDHSTRAWSWHYYASEVEKLSLFNKDIVRESSLRWFEKNNFQTPIDYIRHDRAFYFPNEMLSKVDRMTMAFGVEGRSPFAAPSVQGFAEKLPWSVLIKNNQLKWVLREAFKDSLTNGVVSREKHGFNVPIDHWLRGEWSDLFNETFSPSSPLSRLKILSPNARLIAKRLLDDPNAVAGHVIFSFVMLNIWALENEL